MMSKRSATIANKDVLASYGAAVDLCEMGSTTISLNSWSFSTSHDIILDSRELDELTRRLNNYFTSDVDGAKSGEADHLMVNNCKLHLPAMIFGKDTMRISCHIPTQESPCSISFNAEDALKGWLVRHTTEYKLSHSWSVIQVPMAQQWTKRQESDLKSGGKAIELADVQPWDWTFSTDYCGTLSIHGKEVFLCARSLRDHPCIKPINESGLDMSILQDRSQPILFYDEAILYQVGAVAMSPCSCLTSKVSCRTI
jgi:hypothetical protein